MLLGAPLIAAMRVRQQLQRWANGHPRLAISAAAAMAGTALAVYGSGGSLKFLGFAVPETWAAVIILMTAAAAGKQPRSALVRWLAWSTWPALVIQQLAYVADHQRGDPLVIGAWMVLLVALEMAEATPGRLGKSLGRLRDREVLSASPDDVNKLQADLERDSRQWSAICAVAVALLLLVTWPRLGDLPHRWTAWSSGPAVLDQVWVMAAGVAAGQWLGRMIGFGRIGQAMARRGLALRVIPAHPDGAAGLKPIGNFYLYQSLIATIPAAFLGGWVLVVSFAGRSPAIGHYHPFAYQYAWLLVLAIAVTVLVFAIPLVTVHSIMSRQKEAVLLPEADRLLTQAQAIQSRLLAANPDEQKSLDQQLAMLTRRYQELEATPTWPVDTSIRRQFATRNIGLVLPVAGFLIKNWQPLSHLIH
jgi:hypothetical protein